LQSLTHKNSIVRSAASMVIVAAQSVLRDQAHLFTLLDGLSEEKKNFLTYMFNKNDVQMGYEKSRDGSASKVEAEIAKLDLRSHPR